jgi:hypothetical protein
MQRGGAAGRCTVGVDEGHLGIEQRGGEAVGVGLLDVAEGEARHVPQLVAELGVAHNARDVQVDVAPLLRVPGEGLGARVRVRVGVWVWGGGVGLGVWVWVWVWVWGWVWG